MKRFLLAFGLVWLVLLAVRRERPRRRAEVPATRPQNPPRRVEDGPAQRGSVRLQHIAAVFVAAVLFVTGAALGGSISARADDSALPEDVSNSTTEEATTLVAPPEEAAPVTTEEAAPAESPEPVEAPTSAADAPPAPPPSDGAEAPSPEPSLSSPEPSPSEPTWSAPADTLGQPDNGYQAAPAPEIEGPGEHAIVWLHRVLSDPTPAAHRLSPRFAANLRAAARAAGVRWSLVLAVLRVEGRGGRVPASPLQLSRLAERLASAGASRSAEGAVRRVTGSESRTEQVMALDAYNRAVGLRSLVSGLASAREGLERRILSDPRIVLYSGGRSDIASGRLDVRVLVVVRYLRVTFGQVTVTSLHSGHRYYARPGVVSAHMYGLALDIGAVGGVPVTGHQQPGGMTQMAIEAILRLPAELQPQQVISLLGLGGPSLPLADHYDHIHVGF